jgi:hypothetical protein
MAFVSALGCIEVGLAQQLSVEADFQNPFPFSLSKLLEARCWKNHSLANPPFVYRQASDPIWRFIPRGQKKAEEALTASVGVTALFSLKGKR